MQKHRSALLIAALPLATALSAPGAVVAQGPTSKEISAALNTDSMRARPGAPWSRRESRHFVLYAEFAPNRMSSLLDSLEAAWEHATELTGYTRTDTARITVFQTASRTRFPLLVRPKMKGLMARSQSGREIIVLVINDSVRSYARHEVMHAVAFRAWGGQVGSRMWMQEAVATFADGQCQGVPIAVVARDLLREQPQLTAKAVTERFAHLSDESRATSYVLAGSLIEFLWSTRGRDGVKRIWTGTDSLAQPIAAGGGLLDPSAQLGVAWRAYVEGVSGTREGISAASLERHGCG